MKKNILVIVILILGILFVSGCGNNKNRESDFKSNNTISFDDYKVVLILAHSAK